MSFAHENLPLVGISGKPFVDFTKYSHCDFSLLDNEICLGLAKNDTTQMPIVAGQIPDSLRLSEYRDLKFETEYLNNCTDQTVLDSISNLTVNQRRKYLYFKNKIVSPWSFIFVLKPNNFSTKSQDLQPWENCVNRDFFHTRKFIETLPFKSIGRVVIYGSSPNMAVPCHRDQPMSNQLDHHINFNPGGYRPVYVYDSYHDTKTYLDSDYRLYGYNVRDYHGVDSIDHFSYTVRVDGTYNDVVLEQLSESH